MFILYDNNRPFLMAQAVTFVHSRLEQGFGLEEIVKEVLQTCLADNPRDAQGIGSDNMTFIIVLLK